MTLTDEEREAALEEALKTSPKFQEMVETVKSVYVLQHKMAELNGRIANLQDENEQLKFDKKYAEAQLVEVRHELAMLNKHYSMTDAKSHGKGRM